jgi:predicted AAA+ superfamily ATPase
MIRKIEPFSNFLEVAAQMNGEVLNYTKIARDIGVDTKSVQAYYQILEDTLLGFRVPAYRCSIRKRQLTNPKFYLFDTGIKRALDRTLTVSLLPQTYAFGNAFEHFLILEMHRLNEYQKLDFRFSYLKTHDGAEIDLIIERPGKPIALVEIKSTQRVTPQMIKHLETFSKEFSQCHACLLSLDEKTQKFGRVQSFPWQSGLEYLGF